ncbi:MAG TPA: hypothetical protein VMT46_14610 [Anaerolineaceae bacterium]|nr:hypothetical protein [Anaerolineaceae bacterium]
MKTYFTSQWIKPLAAGALLLLIAFSAMAFVPAPVNAQSPTPEPNAPSAADRAANRNQRLENALMRENNWLNVQAYNLMRMGQLATKGQELIDKAKAKGWDVSEIRAALDTFNSRRPKAQASHDAAAGILSAHNGFDANGKVTDADAAQKTILDARKNLQDAHLTMLQAVTDLRIAIREFRDAHRGELKPVPTAAPAGNS